MGREKKKYGAPGAAARFLEGRWNFGILHGI